MLRKRGLGLKSSCFMTLAVSMAVTAASEPLLPALPPNQRERRTKWFSNKDEIECALSVCVRERERERERESERRKGRWWF